ncbi:MAG: cytochrome b/b6 domain-containing protein [Desulfatibacillaceae bacterium]|nr:cytochrome b/b6 domain-containing protein [Desulfatibacillaceae bacterium]
MTPHRENKIRLKRFSATQRLFHLALIISFMIQSATGLARMYIETPFGTRLAWIFGGFEASLAVHKVVGIIMICGFAVHIIYILATFNWKGFPASLFGPDSLIPGPNDLKQFFQHVLWFFGLAKEPKVGRWGYWEKFDYWAVFWGIPILGITGLLLAYPLASSEIVPGWGLNVAFWIHRIEAILAMTHVFIIHFFIGHLRRRNFPMDRAMFEGSVDMDHARHERPQWLAHLKEAGELEKMMVPEAGPGAKTLYYLFGYCAIAIGVMLLIGGLVNSTSITW